MAKICRVCKEIKEIEDFYIDKHYASGRNSKCKVCHSKYNRKYTISRRKENRDAKEYIVVDKKYCYGCFEEKNIDNFTKCHANLDGYRGKCKDCYKNEYKEITKKRINSYSNLDFITCTKCNKVKKHEEFGYSGLRRKNILCKECFREKAKKQNKSISQVCFLSHEDYQKLLEQQNNVCAICKLPETRTLKGLPARLSVDHCHQNEEKGINKIRGLLCTKCNSGLGWFQDSIINLKEAIKYLESQN